MELFQRNYPKYSERGEAVRVALDVIVLAVAPVVPVVLAVALRPAREAAVGPLGLLADDPAHDRVAVEGPLDLVAAHDAAPNATSAIVASWIAPYS